MRDVIYGRLVATLRTRTVEPRIQKRESDDESHDAETPFAVRRAVKVTLFARVAVILLILATPVLQVRKEVCLVASRRLLVCERSLIYFSVLLIKL